MNLRKSFIMDAKTLFSLVKPHLETMDAEERKSLAILIRKRHSSAGRRKNLSLPKAKEKLRRFHLREMQKERT